MKRSKRLEVKIPAGVTDGSRVRVAGEGGFGAGGGARGDLYLLVSVRPHATYERKGDDLYSEVAVPLTLAVLGGEVEVPTLKGKVSLAHPARDAERPGLPPRRAGYAAAEGRRLRRPVRQGAGGICRPVSRRGSVRSSKLNCGRS